MKEINAYLIFNGNCREAMTFYQKCLGADLQMLPFSDAPGANIPNEAKDRIMHARLVKGTTVLMASDDMPGMPFQQGSNFFISLNCEDVQEVEKLFSSLSVKGKVKQAAGDLTDNETLKAEGAAQAGKGAEERKATETQAKAQAHEKKAEMHAQKQEAAEA